MFRPVRALISRDPDENHERLHNIPGMIAGEPQLGEPMQMFLDSGKVMRTSVVKNYARRGPELVVDTANSRYRLLLQAA